MSARDRALLWLRRGGGSFATAFLVGLARDRFAELEATHPGFGDAVAELARAALATSDETRDSEPAVRALAFAGEVADLALLRRAVERAPGLAATAAAATWEIRRRAR